MANSLLQVSDLSQVSESHPCSVCSPAHILLKPESPLRLLGFRLITFVLTNRSPWCPAACFQTPFNCSVAVEEITEGLTEAN